MNNHNATHGQYSSHEASLADKLAKLQSLTASQYDIAKAAAIKRIQRQAGERPTRDAYKREYRPGLGVMSWFLWVIFFAAFVISASHIMQVMGKYAVSTYDHNQVAGIVITLPLWVIVHQLGAIAMSEGAIVYFMVWHNLHKHERVNRPWYLKPLTFASFLAVGSAIFVLRANLMSGDDLFIAILPPLFTLGLSMPLEAMIVEYQSRNADIDRRYHEAMDNWQKATTRPEDHPDYPKYLRYAVWERLMALKSNAAYENESPDFKRLAVERELSRDNWASEEEASGSGVNGYALTDFFRSDSHAPAVVTIQTAPANYKRVYINGEASQ